MQELTNDLIDEVNGGNLVDIILFPYNLTKAAIKLTITLECVAHLLPRLSHNRLKLYGSSKIATALALGWGFNKLGDNDAAVFMAHNGQKWLNGICLAGLAACWINENFNG